MGGSSGQGGTCWPGAGPCPGLTWLWGWWPTPVTGLRRSWDRVLSCFFPLWLPCEVLEQPQLWREKMNAFFSLCRPGVYQGCRHYRDSCTFLVLDITLSTSRCAPCCAEGSLGSSLSCHSFLCWVGWGPMEDRAGGDAEHWVWQNKPQRCLFAGGGSKRRTNPVFVPRLISQINLHLSTTQEGQGGSLLQHLGKK